MEQINKVLYNIDQTGDTTEAQKAQARANIGIHDQGHGNWLVPDRPQPDNDLILTTDRYGTMQWAPQAEAGGIKPSQLSSYILAGDNITITPGSSSITISSTGGTQLQSNWAESDSSSVQFIQNKPTIPVVPSMKTLVAGNNVSIVEGANDVTISATAAPQLQANWNETSTSSVQYIQNKPTIPTLPTMKPLVAGSNITITEGVSDITIASTGGASQVQSNWTESDTTSPAYIQNKPTIPSVLSAGTGINIANDTISVDLNTVQEKLTAGNNVTISNNVIAATDTTYTFSTGLTESSGTVTVDNPVPAYNSTMAGDILAVNSAGTGVEWIDNQVPAYTSSDQYKVLSVSYNGYNTQWRDIREVPSYAVANTGKLLGVVNNGGSIELAWTQPTGYWTSSTSLAQGHDVTAEDIAAGYFDLYMQITATDTSTSLYDSPAFFALSWDVQWHTQGSPGNLDSLTFAAGVEGGSYVDLFSDTSPAHAVHKDWGITKAWATGNRYNRIRVRFALNSTTQVGDGFMLYAGGIVNQVRG